MQLIDAGKAVRAMQSTQGFTNAEFARIAKSSPQQVIRWRNQKNMKIHTMQHICDALNTQVIEFFILGK